MAMSGAERSKRYNDKKRKELGKEEYSRVNHEAYERRKLRAANAMYKAELRRLREERYAQQRGIEFSSQGESRDPISSRVNEFYGAVKLGLTLAYSNNMLKELSLEEREKIELWARDATLRMIRSGWDFEAVKNRWVSAVNVNPLPLSDFFFEIADKLDDEEVDAWEFIYRLLKEKSPGEEVHTTAYIIEYESGVPQREAYQTLQRLQELGVISFRDDDSNPHLMLVQPIWIAMGTNWKE